MRSFGLKLMATSKIMNLTTNQIRVKLDFLKGIDS